MNRLDDTIDALVADATPVRRGVRPSVQAALWLGFAMIVGGAALAWHGPRGDLAARLSDPVFFVSIAATVATGALAGAAALIGTLPDRSPLWRLLPLPSAAIWLSTVSLGCLSGWVSLDPSRIGVAAVGDCLGILAAVGTPLAVWLFWMLRPLIRLRLPWVVPLGSLAIAAFAAAILNLTHAFDASVMILAWNFGAAALVMAISAVAGRIVVGQPARL